MAEGKNKKEQLQHRREDSTARLDEWKKSYDTFTGRGGYKTGRYLWNFPREEKDFYEYRQDSCTYLNLMRSAVNKFVGWLHPKDNPPTWTGAPNGFDEWVSAVNLFEKTPTLVRYALIFGLSHSVIDKPASDDVESDEPYIVMYKPSALLDWNEIRNAGGGATGKYSQAKFRIVGVESNVITAESDNYERFYIWSGDKDGEGTAEVWELKMKEGEDEGDPDRIIDIPWPHPIAPVSTLNFVLDPQDNDSVPVFDSLVECSILIFNLMSMQRAYYEKAIIHPVLVVPENGDGTLNEDDDEDAPAPIDPVKNNIISFPADSSQAPSVLYGDASPLDTIREDINANIDRATFVAGMRSPTQMATAPKSGESHKQEFMDTAAILSMMQQEMQQWFKNLMLDFAVVNGDTNWDVSKASCTWPVATPDLSEFDLEDILEMLRSPELVDKSPILLSRLILKLVKKLEGNNPDLVEEIEKEIEERMSSDSSAFPQRGVTDEDIDDEDDVVE